MIYNCVIIGGGISGISFAHYLKEKGEDNILLIDKNDYLGGRIKTTKFNNTFYLEQGSHTCYNSYYNLISLLKNIDKSNNIIPLNHKKFLINSADGKFKNIFSQLSIIPIILNIYKIFSVKRSDKTVKEYFKLIFSEKNYNKILSKIFRAVLCQDADEYPAELMMKKRNKKYKNIPHRFSFKNGMSQMIEDIVNTNNLDVCLSCEVEKITKDNQNNYNITTKSGKTYISKSIAFATDPQSAQFMIKDIDPDIANLLTGINTSTIESINVTINKKDLKIKEFAALITSSNDFLSVLSRDTIKNDKYRGFTFHFKYNKDININQRLDTISKTLSLDKSNILKYEKTEHTIPLLRKSSIDICNKIDSLTKNKNIYLLGNYFYGMSIEDCVSRSLEQANRKLQSIQNK